MRTSGFSSKDPQSHHRSRYSFGIRSLAAGGGMALSRHAFLVFAGIAAAVWASQVAAQHDHAAEGGALPGAGEIGQPAPELGAVDLPINCSEAAQQEFDVGLAQLHHMMYEQARPRFAAAAEADAQCAMAHWGIAMTLFHPLWTPTPEGQLESGQAAVDEARRLVGAESRERGFIAAAEAFFTDPEPALDSATADHAARVESWMHAQRALHNSHPNDVEAAAFYALAKIAHAQAQFAPADEPDFTRQREAGAMLEGFLDDHPRHPGLHHYIIHAYDNTELAPMAESVARAYDQIAPETTHALHMPGHIFVRLGKWHDNVEWNERSAAAALAQAHVDSHAKMHYAHALDYMMYGYLQLGEEDKARDTLERVRAVRQMPSDAASAYGLAAAQARFVLERARWEEAAGLERDYPEVIDWARFPESQALFAYARGVGAAHLGNLDQAEEEAARIERYVSALRAAGSDYWAYMTEALGEAVRALVLYERDESEAALTRMRAAADLEDSMEKHPVSPGEVLPVRELYAALLLREGRTADAVDAFEASLARTPQRRNALEGLERARLIQ
jgi:hypothetical protein